MGKRGPIPKPTANKLREGVRRDRVNPREPRPSPSPDPPEPPPDLGDEAREVWGQLAPDLHRQGQLTAWDVHPFACYCDLVVQVRRAREYLARGLVVAGRRDGLVTNPAWRVYRDAITQLRLLAHEFGLTPSARSGLAAPESEPPGID